MRAGIVAVSIFIILIFSSKAVLYADNLIDNTPPEIYTDIFGDFGYEVLFDVRDGIRVWAEDDSGGMALLRINPSYCQNTYVNDLLTPYICEGDFEVHYQYPNGNEYGYVITAVDLAGNVATRVIITRRNVTAGMKRIIPRGNYD